MKQNNKYQIVGLCALLLGTLSATKIAIAEEDAKAKGLAIAMEMDLRDTGFGDFKAEMDMLLRTRHGKESSRKMHNRTLENADGDKTVIVFDLPRDVKGTALLTWTHKAKADDQWLFMPALKRVKRISSRNKSGPFMGSEFAYEDMSSQEVEKYDHRYLKDEVYEGMDCFVIERIPRSKTSGYTRQDVWVDKAEYRPIKIDFYDRKKSLLKTLVLTEYKKYLDKFWRAGVLAMQNHQTGKSTKLSWRNFVFRNGFADKDFSKNSLKRAR